MVSLVEVAKERVEDESQVLHRTRNRNVDAPFYNIGSWKWGLLRLAKVNSLEFVQTYLQAQPSDPTDHLHYPSRRQDCRLPMRLSVRSYKRIVRVASDFDIMENPVVTAVSQEWAQD